MHIPTRELKSYSHPYLVPLAQELERLLKKGKNREFDLNLMSVSARQSPLCELLLQVTNLLVI